MILKFKQQKTKQILGLYIEIKFIFNILLIYWVDVEYILFGVDLK